MEQLHDILAFSDFLDRHHLRIRKGSVSCLCHLRHLFIFYIEITGKHLGRTLRIGQFAPFQQRFQVDAWEPLRHKQAAVICNSLQHGIQCQHLFAFSSRTDQIHALLLCSGGAAAIIYIIIAPAHAPFNARAFICHNLFLRQRSSRFSACLSALFFPKNAGTPKAPAFCHASLICGSVAKLRASCSSLGMLSDMLPSRKEL